MRKLKPHSACNCTILQFHFDVVAHLIAGGFMAQLWTLAGQVDQIPDLVSDYLRRNFSTKSSATQITMVATPQSSAIQHLFVWHPSMIWRLW
jgi:hypothetical protein